MTRNTDMDLVNSVPLMKGVGLLVLAALVFGFMRVRRHPVANAALVAGGIVGGFFILTILKVLFF